MTPAMEAHIITIQNRAAERSVTARQLLHDTEPTMQIAGEKLSAHAANLYRTARTMMGIEPDELLVPHWVNERGVVACLEHCRHPNLPAGNLTKHPLRITCTYCRVLFNEYRDTWLKNLQSGGKLNS